MRELVIKRVHMLFSMHIDPTNLSKMLFHQNHVGQMIWCPGLDLCLGSIFCTLSLSHFVAILQTYLGTFEVRLLRLLSSFQKLTIILKS